MKKVPGETFIQAMEILEKQMNQQDNRMTSHPIWQVRHKQYLVTEQDYNESHWEIVETDEGRTLYHSEKDSDYSELARHLIDSHPEWVRYWAEYEADIAIELLDGEVDKDDYDRLIYAFNSNFDPDYQDFPEQLKKFHMQEIEVVVKACLTEADAIAFIKRKQHDYPRLYTHVESMVFCPQMIELRDWIISLTEGRQ